MGHASAAMTALYTGEIPLEDVRTEFRLKFGPTILTLRKCWERDSSVNPSSRIKALRASDADQDFRSGSGRILLTIVFSVAWQIESPKQDGSIERFQANSGTTCRNLEKCGQIEIKKSTVSPFESGAGDGNRTHVRSLGSFHSAIELRPPALNLADYTRLSDWRVPPTFSIFSKTNQNISPETLIGIARNPHRTIPLTQAASVALPFGGRISEALGRQPLKEILR